jgi:HAD superfamily hydrolase (TIGR01484 family)
MMESIEWIPPGMNNPPQAMVITDLDGTLLNDERKCASYDHMTLMTLEKLNISRIIATGRHLFSFSKVIEASFPIDYVIFSSGAGIWHFKEKKIIRKICLEKEEVEKAAKILISLNLDFFVHNPIPDNHHCTYYRLTNNNSDFSRRISVYRDFAFAGDNNNMTFNQACQLLTILPPDDKKKEDVVYKKVQEYLPDFTVIRTTSPLDGISLWIEVFPENVSKGKTSLWLSKSMGIIREKVCAVGNDYNDKDLLSWAGTSFVVGNAPDELKTQFSVVSSHNECGFSEAVTQWLSLLYK